MKKLFGVVFVTFALSLVAGSIISCSQQAPANQGKWNASSFAYTKYGNIMKDNDGSEIFQVIRFVSKKEWEWSAGLRDGTYSNLFRGTYVVEDDKILLKVTWCAVKDSSFWGKTLVSTIVNNKKFILLDMVWNKF